MPQKPKKTPACADDPPENTESSAWSEDQKLHEYYYDDAHGYEVYDPNGNEDDDEERDL